MLTKEINESLPLIVTLYLYIDLIKKPIELHHRHINTGNSICSTLVL
jgi:hypothetical protein